MVIQARARTRTADPPPIINGRRVSLRPLETDDSPVLYGWRLAADNQPWLFGKGLPAYEEFLAELPHLQQRSLTLAVFDKHQTAGFVHAHSLNIDSQWCFVAAYAVPGYEGTSEMVEAAAMFVDYLFQRFKFQKIYMDLLEEQADQFQPLLGSLFREEGRFVEHLWIEGELRDVLRLAVYQEAWAEGRDRVLISLRVGDEIGGGGSRGRSR